MDVAACEPWCEFCFALGSVVAAIDLRLLLPKRLRSFLDLRVSGPVPAHLHFVGAIKREPIPIRAITCLARLNGLFMLICIEILTRLRLDPGRNNRQSRTKPSIDDLR